MFSNSGLLEWLHLDSRSGFAMIPQGFFPISYNPQTHLHFMALGSRAGVYVSVCVCTCVYPFTLPEEEDKNKRRRGERRGS